MSEEIELTGGATGLDRRDFIKRSAVVGGMVWAAPVISSIGSPAFAMTPGGTDISNIAFLLNNVSTNFKYDSAACANVSDGSAEPCVADLNIAPAPWPGYLSDWNLAATGTDSDGKVTVTCGASWTIDPTANYNIVFVAVKAGNFCYYFDTSNLAKDEAFSVQNDSTWLFANADLVIKQAPPPSTVVKP
jgi:hypothetical protein